MEYIDGGYYYQSKLGKVTGTEDTASTKCSKKKTKWSADKMDGLAYEIQQFDFRQVTGRLKEKSAVKPTPKWSNQ